MDIQAAKKLVKKLISRNTLCTLATASLQGKPEAATIEYGEDEGMNLFFETFLSYRKYLNLKSNPKASIVITEVPHTIQMDGNVEELSGDEAEVAKQLLVKKHGEGSGFYSDPEIKFFKFTPNWIRVLVNDKWPPKYVIIKGR